MMRGYSFRSFTRFAIGAGVVAALGACTDEPPTVLVEAVDCPRDAITLDVDVRKTEVQSRDWIIAVDAQVLCNDRPVRDAVIRVVWWWGEVELGRTDEDGQVTVDEFSAENDPTGKAVEVTLRGADGDITRSARVP